MAGWALRRTIVSTVSAPIATPAESETCWPTAESEVARLIFSTGTSA